MISHGKDIKIFTGNANPKLAADICKIIGTKLGESEVKSFADGEASVSLYETVRGSDVFLVQSTCKPVNDSLMELLIMVDACRRASAGRITAVMPYFGYARQDRKAKSRDPISAKLVANMLVAAGVDRVLTMDLHANQIQGFFDVREERDHRNAEFHALAGDLEEFVDAQAVDAGHGRNRLAKAGALDHEDRENQIVGGHDVFAHQAAGEVVMTHAAHANAWIRAMSLHLVFLRIKRRLRRCRSLSEALPLLYSFGLS